jgi:hypothetical protein
MQSAARGAEPTLLAATAPGAKAGGYYGPGGLGVIFLADSRNNENSGPETGSLKTASTATVQPVLAE